jgi:hypothetical protein
MKQFLFLLSSTESYSIPASSFKYVEELSDTTVGLHFNLWRNGVEGSAKVTLTVSSGKANDVVSAIASQIGNSNTSVFRYDAINSKYFTANVTGITDVAITSGSGGFNLLDGDGTSVLIDLDKEVKVVEGTGIDIDWTDTSTGSAADPYDLTISCDLEGTELKSTGEGGGSKFLREDGDGTCSWQTIATGTPTAITVADESSDTTCFPLFATAATGDLAPKTGSNLAFNSSTGELTVDGVITAKTLHYINCNLYDDIGTTKHYLPIGSPPNEQTSDGNTYVEFLCPCNLRVVSVLLKLPSTTTGSGTITLDVQASNIGSFPTSPSSVETEAVAVADSNDNDVVYFAFDNAALTVGQNLSISIVSDADLSGSANWYCTVVMEMDWSTRYTGSSAVKT